MNFGQIVTAMVTPFDENGEIDFQATRNLIDHLIANGSDGLVVAGTTGESPTLSNEEKVQLFRFTVEVVNGRVPVIAGTGSNNTRESIELTMRAEDAGVDGIMLVAPYYNNPCQEGMVSTLQHNRSGHFFTDHAVQHSWTQCCQHVGRNNRPSFRNTKYRCNQRG